MTRPPSPPRSLASMSGSGGPAPSRAKVDRKPDWKVWKQVPACELWKAVALSFDIEPGKVSGSSQFIGGDLRFSGEADEFRLRLYLASSNSAPGIVPPFPIIADAEPPDRVVSLPGFARWLVAIYPDEVPLGFLALSMLVDSRTTPPITPASGPPPTARRRGKKPIVMTRISELMKADYTNRPDDLAKETQEVLANRYNASHGTIRRARETTLEWLRALPNDRH